METLRLNNNFWIFVLKRILIAVLVIFILSILIFSIFHESILQARNAAFFKYMEENNIRDIVWGLDEPLLIQYFHWIGGIFRGDFY